jgi:NAD(P)-dependent dehydrogenase (short-subunit alcohol dehydrogenase family)
METIRANFDMNFFSTVACCKAFIPGMVSGRFGRVILMGSIAGNNGGSGTTTPHYGPAKAAIHCLARSLTQTYAAAGVNINCIAPGVIDNGFHAAHTSAENMQKMVDRIPQGRPGRNEEVGAVAAFLASPAASHMSGDVLHVNGGMLFGS